MNLISCNGCGLVFDKDKLKFPYELYDEEMEEFDMSKCVWHCDKIIAKVECIVCGEDILEFP